MNEKIKELTKKLKALRKQREKLSDEETDLMIQIRDLEEAEAKAKIEKKFHAGDYFLNNIGIVNYHCDVLYLYEILEVTTGRWPKVKVREYKIGYADGDYYTHIEKSELRMGDYTLCHIGKRIKTSEVEEVKNIIYNPELYEESKWNTGAVCLMN